MDKKKQLYAGIISLVVALLVCIVLTVILIVQMRSKGADEPRDSVKTVVVDTVVVTDTVEVKKPEKPRLNVKPLTQYALVEVGDYDAGFRDAGKMASILKGLGFKTKVHNPTSDDPFVEELILEASRVGNNGTTTLKLNNGEYPMCVINFANQEEADAFVESMKKSNYSQDGTLFIHPKTVEAGSGFTGIFVRVKGKNIKLVTPYEGLPPGF